MPSVLNVGGGSKAVAIPAHYEGWEHLLLDIDPKRGVDVVCDARLLGEKFSAGSYDAIYCSHNLEHYYLHDVKKVLGGFLHVLKEEGFAEIRVPDIGELIRLLASAQLDLDQEIYKSSVGGISAHDMIYGYGPEIEESGQDFYAHKAGFTRRTLANALFENGFAEVYFAPPMALLELHVFAFKRAATERVRTSLVLGERYLPDTGPARTARPSIAAADRAIQNREADPVDALYAQAVAAWNDEHWAEAIRLADAALKLDGSLPALHYLAGCCRMEAGDTTAAVKDFDACLGLAPGYPLSGQALARRALGLARSGLAQGTKATELTLAPDDVRSVSVIMCSANPARFAEAKARYERLLQGLPHEIVGISDARSLAEGYNRGLAKARNDIVVFAHDDVEIVSPDFAARLLAGLRRHDVVGIAGTCKIEGGAWHFAGHPHLRGQIAMPSGQGLVVTVYGVPAESCGGLLALDGLLLATNRETALRIGFDEQTFDGWHLYDLDFSLRASRAGLYCATRNDILAVHASQGSYDQDWLRYSERFLAKHQLQRGGGIFHQPELVSLPVSSSQEWRLMTEHLISAGTPDGFFQVPPPRA